MLMNVAPLYPVSTHSGVTPLACRGTAVLFYSTTGGVVFPFSAKVCRQMGASSFTSLPRTDIDVV